jgi:hypothetical protein
MRIRNGFVVVALIVASGAIAAARQNAPTPQSGLWHLLPADQSETPIPQHRVDIRLSMSSAPMRAAMVNRTTGADMPPYTLAEFDGETLRLGIRSRVEGSAGQLVVLRMKWDGARFTGLYVNEQGEPIAGGVALKLIKSTP